MPDSQRFYAADVVLIAMGFLGPEKVVLEQLHVDQDPRSTNITTGTGKYATSVQGIFAAGDCRRGQSLVVWGINEGRMCATDVDAFLMGGAAVLPARGGLAIPASTPASVNATK